MSDKKTTSNASVTLKSNDANSSSLPREEKSKVMPSTDAGDNNRPSKTTTAAGPSNNAGNTTDNNNSPTNNNAQQRQQANGKSGAPAPPPVPHPVQYGDIIGDYVIGDEIGRGQYAVVYKATRRFGGNKNGSASGSSSAAEMAQRSQQQPSGSNKNNASGAGTAIASPAQTVAIKVDIHPESERSHRDLNDEEIGISHWRRSLFEFPASLMDGNDSSPLDCGSGHPQSPKNLATASSSLCSSPVSSNASPRSEAKYTVHSIHQQQPNHSNDHHHNHHRSGDSSPQPHSDYCDSCHSPPPSGSNNTGMFSPPPPDTTTSPSLPTFYRFHLKQLMPATTYIVGFYNPQTGTIDAIGGPSENGSANAASPSSSSANNNNRDGSKLPRLPPNPPVLRTSRGHRCVVQEYVCGGDLKKTVATARGKCLSERNARAVIFQLLIAVCQCHSHRVAHRDIKPANLLHDGKGTIKLCDFGFSIRPSHHSGLCNKAAGSPTFMSPEALLSNSYDPFAADIWAVGVTMYHLLTGKYPFNGRRYQDLVESVASGVYQAPTKWQAHLTFGCLDLLRRLLTVDVCRRPNALDALAHPWFVAILPNAAVASPTASRPPSLNNSLAGGGGGGSAVGASSGGGANSSNDSTVTSSGVPSTAVIGPNNNNFSPKSSDARDWILRRRGLPMAGSSSTLPPSGSVSIDQTPATTPAPKTLVGSSSPSSKTAARGLNAPPPTTSRTNNDDDDEADDPDNGLEALSVASIAEQGGSPKSRKKTPSGMPPPLRIMQSSEGGCEEKKEKASTSAMGGGPKVLPVRILSAQEEDDQLRHRTTNSSVGFTSCDGSQLFATGDYETEVKLMQSSQPATTAATGCDEHLCTKHCEGDTIQRNDSEEDVN